ncbi:MAG: helix-turn-helix domain-containing protein [Lachnospiraceae bacterium]|jgi:hypothetical protein|nr:helix-turn-helix domain-containing protein [Lachnospiraceae bacterium]
MDKLNEYVTAKEMAERWDVSVRQVQFWCNQDKIEGVVQFGKSWAISDKVRVTDGNIVYQAVAEKGSI